MEAEDQRLVSAKKYLSNRGKVSNLLNSSIIKGKVVLGMFPDEAIATAGPYVYSVKADSKWGENYFPLDVIFSQREYPDSSKITLLFNNRTQYDTIKPNSFTVKFENGKAVEIKKDGNLF